MFQWSETNVTLSSVHGYGSRCARPDDYHITICGDLEGFSQQVGALLAQTGELSHILVGFKGRQGHTQIDGADTAIFRLTSLPAFRVGSHITGYPYNLHSTESEARSDNVCMALLPRKINVEGGKKRLVVVSRVVLGDRHAGSKLWLGIDLTKGALQL